MVENRIKIQQTIHGYKEGHTLLSSSLDLSIGERKELQLLSDYSGTGVESNFNEYITGFPLTNSKYYALAKTWYAGEMPRPGSVWTHTLLIEISAIWTIKNFDLLLSAFKRPEKDKINKNLEALYFSIEDLNTRKVLLSRRQNLISCSLYTTNKPLVIFSTTENEFQSDVLNIWTYQWPRLKRNFSFCTGSMALRSIGREAFDLQIMPQGRERMLARNDKERFSFFDVMGRGCDNEFLKVYKDEDPEKVLDFMTKFGSDIFPNRKNFWLLLKCYDATKNIAMHAYEDLKNLMVEQLPSSSEGRVLKSSLVQLLFNSQRQFNYDLITALLTENSFSELNWDFALLIYTSWSGNNLTSTQTIKVLELLKKRPDEQNDFVRLLSTLPLELWISKPNLYKSVLPDIISQNKEFLYNEMIWRSNVEIQELWWTTIPRIKNVHLHRIVFSMLEARNPIYASDIYSLMGDALFNVIFEWLSTKGNALSMEWEYLIRQRPANAFRSLLELERYTFDQLAIIPKILSPTEGAWFEIRQSDFEKFFKKVSKLKEHQLQTSIYTFFITTAFANSTSDPQGLTELIFQPLHDNLQDSIYDFHTWNRFKMLMGRDLYDMTELDFFSKLFKERNEVPDWDHCEFLRRSLISCFLKYKWDPYYLLLIAKDDRTFQNIVEFGVDVKPVRKVLKQVKQKLEENRLQKSLQYKVLDKNL